MKDRYIGNMSKGSSRVVMARLSPLKNNDRSFDLQFWDRVGTQGKFEAAWQMVREWAAWKGIDESQLRFQRTIASLKQRER